MFVQDVLRETEGAGSGASQTPTSQGQSGQSDADYYKAEAKKAFEARDKVKEALRQLEESGRVLAPEQIQRYKDLEAAAEKAEEERKRKAGEFDALRQQLTQKHEVEIKTRDEKLSQLSQRFKDTVVTAEFGKATDWFGGEGAKTILDVELGMAALGRYVRVEDADDDPRGYRVVVIGPSGQTIVGRDGNPAPFAEAMGELIGMLPNKDRILRGSGKTGSGSSGGSHGAGGSEPIDIRQRLKPSDFRDPKVRAALKDQLAAAGGLQSGAAIRR